MNRAIETFGWACVIALAILSATANFRYGLTVASGMERWVYALAGASLDGLKTVLPIQIGIILSQRLTPGTFARALFATLLFIGICAWSLTCALGLYAIAKAEKVGDAAGQQELYRTLTMEKAKAEARLKELTTIRTAETVEGELQAAKQDKRWTSSKACTDATAGPSRDFCASYARLAAEATTAPKTAEAHTEEGRLKLTVLKASTRLDGLNLGKVLRTADPATEALASFLGVAPDRVRSWLTAAIAVLIDAGAGFGGWLISGSHTPGQKSDARPSAIGERRKREKGEAPAIGETASADPVGLVEQWASACIVRRKGSHVPASELRSSFEAWCRARQHTPPGATAFGKKMTELKFERDKKGGVQRYGDVALVAAQKVMLVG